MKPELDYDRHQAILHSVAKEAGKMRDQAYDAHLTCVQMRQSNPHVHRRLEQQRTELAERRENFARFLQR